MGLMGDWRNAGDGESGMCVYGRNGMLILVYSNQVFAALQMGGRSLIHYFNVNDGSTNDAACSR